VLREFDPDITVRHTTLTTQVGDALLQDRLTARLAAIFAGVALLLALLGLYGVVSYGVACRRGEIGLRLALGATRGTVLRMMLADVGRMLVLGSLVGGVAAVLLAQAIGSLLYQLDPGDPTTLVLAIVVLAGAGLAAAAWPSWQAAGTDPSRALRRE
jgi:ABC-type antimicrobial peptide transport system permease subunit